MTKLIYVLFVIHLIFLAYLNNFYFMGLPFRSLLILLIGFLVVVDHKEILAEVALVNRVYAVLMLIGLTVSVINYVSPAGIVNGELKLLQSYLVVLSSYYVIRKLGFKALASAVLMVAVPSALVGILQAANIDIAWSMHDALSHLQNKAVSDDIQMQIEAALVRPPGLALYAIPQTYLLLSALVFGSYFVLGSQLSGRQQWLLLGVNTVLILGIFASETRSAMGAGVLTLFFVYIYRFRGASVAVLASVAALGVLIYIVYSGDAADVNSRLVSLDDASAQGRKTLYKYGMELFLQKPWGYGFNFDTVEYAYNYFINSLNIFDYGPSEKAQYIVPVHNSVLNIAHAYGLAGLLLLMYYVYQLADGIWYRYVFLGCALLNSVFHNAGILYGDLFIDMAIGVFLYESHLRRAV